MSKTIRVFQTIAGRPGRYEHHADQVNGAFVPVDDDRIYTKQGKTFAATGRRMRCAACLRPRQDCHCAPPRTLSTMEAVVQRQRDLGLR